MSTSLPERQVRDQHRTELRARPGVGLVVGFRWWGVTVDDMAQHLQAEGFDARALGIWDIRRRSHRLIMKRERAASWLLSRRIRAVAEETHGWSVVTAPHRLTDRDAQLLAKRGPLSILLADDPVGIRSVSSGVWNEAYSVVSPEPAWLANVPVGTRQRSVFGWGSTITDSELLSGEPYRPERLLIMGAAYRERVEMARRLAKVFPLTVQGQGWEGLVPGADHRPAAGRLETLKAIRGRREMVVNVHHQQFTTGRNPQFFDFASAAIPQLVVHAHELERWRIGFEPASETFERLDLDAPELSQHRLIDGVRTSGTFSDTIAEALA